MRRRLLAGSAAVVALVVALVATVLFLRGGDEDTPRAEVRAYLDAWAASDLGAMAALVDAPPADFNAQHTAMADALGVSAARFEPGPVDRDGDRATAPFEARLTLRGLGDWPYTGRLDLVRRQDRWLVSWTPATLHPELQPGQRFSRARTRPERAPILGAGDRPLTTGGEVVSVGVEPQRVRDRGEVTRALQQQLGVRPGVVDTELGRPGVRPDFFVPIVDVPRDRFNSVRPALEPVPGILFRARAARVAPSPDFARHVLGRTGEVTAEGLARLGGLYQAGDVVGQGGLEAAFESQLAGEPSGEVRLLQPAGETVATLFRFPGRPPAGPVRTTLDLAVQTAAEEALRTVTGPAAIVAVDGTTGAVRAAASRPLSEAFNRALAGRYPPGSTFKVVTTAGLLAGGTTATTPVQCPATRTISGRPFVNFESEALGDIVFRRAFVTSCNTAFVALGQQLGRRDLGAAAARFGFNRRYDVGLTTFGGAFPEPTDDTETAAAAIGQGRVEASPLHMATVAAAGATGGWRQPYLVEPAPTTEAVEPLAAPVATALRQLMVGVVSEGTGTAAAVPGQDVGGKTGTAEFGTGSPLPTHAWFIGFRGTLGFAVLVEDGGVGGEVAAPIAGRFLRALPAT
ncbi:MAG: penicillin-binding transpeptidase domain-containing protein [Actinomycetota bacterium]|nr:penicillin-binding transpeptidase domain-containing protein [Actinomycetota bacterium]